MAVSEPMTDNAALNAIVAELQGIAGILTGAYDEVTGDAATRVVLTEKAVARAADPTAVKTVITNKGPSALEVYEGGVLVLYIPVNKTEVLPLNGAGEIQWRSVGASNAALATYKQTV